MAKSGFNLRKFDHFVSRMKSDRSLRPVYKQWGVRYLSWIKKLYNKKARGGTADGVKWRKLSPATIAGRRAGRTARRKVRGGGRRKRGPSQYSILIDLGILVKALTPGKPGNLFKYIRHGVRVGFGGPAKHPGGKATIRDLAVFHDQGEGRLPKRQILHKPDAKFQKMMRRTLAKGIDRIGKGR